MTCTSTRWIPRSSRTPIRPTAACAPRTPFTRARSASGSSPATRTSPRRSAIRASPRRPSPPSWPRASAFPSPGSGLSMLDRDPPDHTRLRGLVSKAFTPRVVEVLRPTSSSRRRPARRGGRHQGGMDLIEDFAYPLPVIVICEMLGVPLEDRERFKTWGLDIARGLDAILLPPDSDVSKRSIAARQRARRLLPRASSPSAAPPAKRPAVRPHRRRGGRRQAERGGAARDLHPAPRRRSRDDGQPDRQRHAGAPAASRQLHRLRDDPALIVTAVEELLRFDGPVQRTARIPSEDVTIGGRTIPKGELVMPVHRGRRPRPRAVPEPERLDITRTDNRHIAFGWGIHFCLGAPLARIEGQIAIGTLVRRLPNSGWPRRRRRSGRASRCADYPPCPSPSSRMRVFP